MELKISILFAVVIAAILGFSTLDDGESITFLNNTGFNNPQEPPSAFDHDFHDLDLEIECEECHHVYENGVLVKDKCSDDKGCIECHPLKANDEYKIPLFQAFHSGCQGCHKKEGKGPLMCGECHTR
ncbi:MAG: cytochrome c3 family protein [Desulfobacteraceae bacterium]